MFVNNNFCLSLISLPRTSQLLAFMRAQFTFFHQGYDLLHEHDPFMRQVASEVDKLRKDADVMIQEMDSRHSLVTPQHLLVCRWSLANQLQLHILLTIMCFI